MSESGRTTSIRYGFSKSPLDTGDHTLEVSRIDLAAGDSLGPYDHQGAAVYRVESGSVKIELSNTNQAVIWSLVGDPSGDPVESTCDDQCIYQLQGQNSISFNRTCTVKVTSTNTASSTVLVTSLTRKNGEIALTSAQGSEVIIVHDARNPLLPWNRGLV